MTDRHVRDLDHVRFNGLACKGWHNSYGRGEVGIRTALTFDETHPQQNGCRAIEIDVARQDGAWHVRHDPGYARIEPGATLSTWLGYLSAWSAETSDALGHAHDPVVVTVDIKRTEGDDWPESLNRALGALGGGKTFTPVAFAGSRTWPVLGDLRGKFILVLSGQSDPVKDRYRTLPNPLAFVDTRISRATRTVRDLPPGRVFLNLDCRVLSESILDWACRGPYVLRAFGVDNARQWNTLIRGGCNILSSDKLADTTWCCVSSEAPVLPWRQIGCV